MWDRYAYSKTIWAAYQPMWARRWATSTRPHWIVTANGYHYSTYIHTYIHTYGHENLTLRNSGCSYPVSTHRSTKATEREIAIPHTSPIHTYIHMGWVFRKTIWAAYQPMWARRWATSTHPHWIVTANGYHYSTYIHTVHTYGHESFTLRNSGCSYPVSIHRSTQATEREIAIPHTSPIHTYIHTYI